MKVTTNGKVRRTKAEWEAIFTEFEGSGMSAAAFCRRKKLPKSTFAKRWRSRGRRVATRRSAPAGFVELQPPVAAPSVASVDRTFELELPGGVLLRWKA